MAHQFAFLCPHCHHEDSIVKSRCTNCRNSFEQQTDGIKFGDKRLKYPQYLKWMRGSIQVAQSTDSLKVLLPQISSTQIKRPLRISQSATLRQGLGSIVFNGFKKLFRRRIESPKVVAHGNLVLTESNFYFVSKVKTYKYEVSDLTCVTTNGHYFEFKIRKQPFYQIHFHAESPLKYEIIFQKLLSNHYSKTGRKIVEFQPCLKFIAPSMSGIKLSVKNTKYLPFSILQFFVKMILVLKLRLLFLFFMKVKIIGRENLSTQFPFIVISNHQSILDPFIILTYLNNNIGFLTKSTSFCNFIERIFLKVGRGIPTTRYQTDPAVVRHLLKYLNHNIAVGFFPEGERCWDGQMQPFKYSVIRLLIQLRAPIIPIIIENAYQLMPRWARFPRRQEVKLTVCPAFSIVPGKHSVEVVKDWLEDIFLRVLTNVDKKQPDIV